MSDAPDGSPPAADEETVRVAPLAAAWRRLSAPSVRLALALVASLFLLTAETPEAVLYASDTQAPDAGAQRGFPPAAKIARGLRATINLLGYDPYWNGGRQTRFRLDQFGDLRRAGFTGVRVNLLAFTHMDANDTLDPAWMARVDTVASAALRAGLTVILDEHDHVDCRKDVATCGVKLQAFWRQMAPRFADASPRLLFEIMNEPGGPWKPADWNRQLADALDTVRQSNPARTVIVGPACSNSFRCLDQLVLPQADRHLVVTFHYYEPLEFTHQGTTWNPQFARLADVAWGSPADLAAMAANFDTVKAWSKLYERPIYLGEFGAFDAAPQPARVRYVAAAVRQARAHGFGWGLWQLEQNFALYDLKTRRWDGAMLNALFHPATVSPAPRGGAR